MSKRLFTPESSGKKTKSKSKNNRSKVGAGWRLFSDYAHRLDGPTKEYLVAFDNDFLGETTGNHSNSNSRRRDLMERGVRIDCPDDISAADLTAPAKFADIPTRGQHKYSPNDYGFSGRSWEDALIESIDAERESE